MLTHYNNSIVYLLYIILCVYTLIEIYIEIVTYFTKYVSRFSYHLSKTLQMPRSPRTPYNITNANMQNCVKLYILLCSNFIALILHVY